MNILFLTNSKMPFIRRVRVCLEENNNLKSLYFTKFSFISYFKAIFNIHTCDLVWCEFASYHALYGVLLGKIFRKKVITHVHRFEVNDPTFFRKFVIWTINNSDKVVCPSNYIASQIFYLTGKNAEILYNTAPQPKEYKYILSVGALIKRKRHDELILKFKEKYPQSNVKLIIIGRGPEQENLELLIEEYCLNEKVHIISEYIPDILLDILYKNCEQFALLSEDEGMSVAVIEAGMHGKKLWLSDIEPNREYLETPIEKFSSQEMINSLNSLLASL